MARGVTERLYRAAAAGAVVAGGAALLAAPAAAPAWVLPALLLSCRPLARAWAAARGTALTPAVAWGWVALGLGVLTECLALAEPLAGGRPAAGHAAYLGCLAALAALISVLNARTPGGGAWAVLMAMLLLVFLIPWLEGPGLARAAGGLGRLRLDSPWTLFFGLLVLGGVTNYLPTRYGPAAGLLALGFLVEYLALTRAIPTAAGRAAAWGAFPWSLAAAFLTAEARAGAGGHARDPLGSLWLWFRDHWGVVWALRVMERFNRSAEANGWPVRLSWQGVVPVAGGGEARVPAEAVGVLRGLLRRFAGAGRLDRAAGLGGVSPCQPDGPAR